MAVNDRTLTGLPAASGSTISVLDFIYAVIAGNSRKIPLADLNAAISSAPIETGVSRIASLSDAKALIRMQNAGANQLLIPTDAAVAFPIFTTIGVFWEGIGQPSIAAVTPGTTIIYAPYSAFVARRYTMAWVTKLAANLWFIGGETQ